MPEEMRGDEPPPLKRVVIRRKLVPPELGDRVVPRERLTGLVRSRLERSPVLAVSATAGSGKTTAVVLALRELGRPVAWLSLDGSEAAGGRLLVYLEAAVEQHVPEAGQVATDALRSSIPVAEAAGLMAESLFGSGLVLVCDNVERVSQSDAAMEVLSAMARYVPAGVNLILLSRTAIPLDPGSTIELGRIGHVGEADLAFEVGEAAAALRELERSDVDPVAAIRMTGGWVTGVIFEGWRAPDPHDRHGDRASLHDYIGAHIVHGLTPEERQFLVRTSLLDEVTAEDARALGERDAVRIMAGLRRYHLPIAWGSGGTRFGAYPRFREYLVELLGHEAPEVVAAVRRRHATLLLDRGEREEAVDALLALGDVENAWRQAAFALPAMVERMDFAPAARWLDTFDVARRATTPEVDAVVLRVAFALEECRRGVELFDRRDDTWLDALGRIDDGEPLALLTWCLWHAGRLAEAAEVVTRLPEGRSRDVALTMLAMSHDDSPLPFPGYSSAPSGLLDGLLMRIAYMRGRLEGLDEPGSYGPWRTVMGAPWVVAAQWAAGRIEQAVSLYEERRGAERPLWLHTFDAVDLMVDLGRADDAWKCLERGRMLTDRSGSQIYQVLIRITEAKLCLRLHQDPEAADRALHEADLRGAQQHAFLRELGRMWKGLTLLSQDRNEEARTTLAAAVAGMKTGDRRLELATALAYLAEAEWRLGDEDASARSTDLALTVATDVGARHVLLAALADVPGVAVRAADSEPVRMARWHEMTSLLAREGPVRVSGGAPRLVLEQFGEPVLTVDDRRVQPRLSKSMELLSYLIAQPGRTATRQELLDVLFDGRNDSAGRSYLRQALYRLREVLPPELGPVQEDDRYSIAGSDVVVGSAEAVLNSLAQADRQDGETRMRTLNRALAQTERGPFLATLSSPWVDARRAEIDDRITGARLDAARLAFRLDRYREARGHVNDVLRRDPYREQAWQLVLSLAQASGNDDAVLALYQQYVATMRELGMPPSAEVHRLVTRLRQ